MKNEQYFDKMLDYVRGKENMPQDVEWRMMVAMREIEKVVRHKCADIANEYVGRCINVDISDCEPIQRP